MWGWYADWLSVGIVAGGRSPSPRMGALVWVQSCEGEVSNSAHFQRRSHEVAREQWVGDSPWANHRRRRRRRGDDERVSRCYDCERRPGDPTNPSRGVSARALEACAGIAPGQRLTISEVSSMLMTSHRLEQSRVGVCGFERSGSGGRQAGWVVEAMQSEGKLIAGGARREVRAIVQSWLAELWMVEREGRWRSAAEA